jgi:prepilin-type N-terminal cleavage/methylation domain-containing protein/prepilin-type processing-associated H-X9-DG protein
MHPFARARIDRIDMPGENRAAAARGFTLLELLVVTAILALIAGFLFPVLASAREQARRSVCLAHVRQLAAAHHLYTEDYDERLPEWRFRIPVPGQKRPGSVFWMAYLDPYVRGAGITRDPSATEPRLFPAEGALLADYALMTWGPGGDGSLWQPHFQWPGPPYTRSHAQRASETICLMDGFTTTETSWGFEDRHRKGVNAAFLDGHARWLPFKELYRVDADREGYHWYRYATIDR